MITMNTPTLLSIGFAAALISLSPPTLQAQDQIIVTLSTTDMKDALYPKILSMTSQLVGLTNESEGLSFALRYEAPEGTILKPFDGKTTLYGAEILADNDFAPIPTIQNYSKIHCKDEPNVLDSEIRVLSFPQSHEAFIRTALNIKYTTGTQAASAIPLTSLGGEFESLGVSFRYEHLLQNNKKCLRLTYAQRIPHFDRFVFLDSKGKEMKTSGYASSMRNGKHDNTYRFHEESPSGIQIFVDQQAQYETHSIRLHFHTGAENLQAGHLDHPIQCSTAQIQTKLGERLKPTSNRAVLLFSCTQEGELNLQEGQSLQIRSRDGKVLVERAPLIDYKDRHIPFPFKKPFAIQLPLVTDDVHELILQGTLRFKVKNLAHHGTNIQIDTSKNNIISAGGLNYHIAAKGEQKSGIWKMMQISCPQHPEAAFAASLPFEFLDESGKIIRPIVVLNHQDKTKGLTVKFRKSYPLQCRSTKRGGEQVIELPIKQKIYFGVDTTLPKLRNEIKNNWRFP